MRGLLPPRHVRRVPQRTLILATSEQRPREGSGVVLVEGHFEGTTLSAQRWMVVLGEPVWTPSSHAAHLEEKLPFP